MKVTIITATFNSEKTLKQNLASVAKQSYPDIEHLIIDNLSIDGTLDMARDCSHVVKVISEKDNGIYDAINKGIARATGDIIGILNSDDYLAGRDTIAEIVEKFKEDGCDAVYGNLIYVHKENPGYIQRLWIAGQFNKKSFFRGWMPPHPTFYIKKEIYSKYGVYLPGFKYAADYEMILRLLLKHEINASAINKVLVYMRTGGASNKNRIERLNVKSEDRMAWEEVGIKPDWNTLGLKPARKVWQYFRHYFSVQWLVHIPPSHDLESYINERTTS